MIATENSPKSPPEASTPLLGGSAASASLYAPHTAYAVHQPVYAEKRGKQSALRRFATVFLAAIGLWVLASALLGSMPDSFHLQRFSFGRSDEYPVPPDVALEHCVSGWGEESKRSPIGGFPYYAELSLDAALLSETLLLLSKGSLSSGNLKITTSSAARATDMARIDIAVHYYTTAVRDTAKVCFITRKEGESGVGIFTPTYWRDRRRTDRLYFEVELILPRNSSSYDSPMLINGLATDVSNFSQDLDNLQDSILFKNVVLRGSNGRIHAKALHSAEVTAHTSNGAVAFDYLLALAASVRSSNGRISGNYQLAKSLDLVTSNGNINVAVGINGSEASNSLVMRTSNSAIDAVINLDTTSGTGGKFLVKADTSNGHLTTRVASAPLDSVLTLNARTSNSMASLELPATYEGKLALYTSNAPSSPIQRLESHEKDPACKAHSDCKGRSRTVETHVVTKGRTEGEVYWEKKNSKRGSATLRSSNGAVTIYV